jgi:hypothetical protein
MSLKADVVFEIKDIKATFWQENIFLLPLTSAYIPDIKAIYSRFETHF